MMWWIIFYTHTLSLYFMLRTRDHLTDRQSFLFYFVFVFVKDKLSPAFLKTAEAKSFFR